MPVQYFKWLFKDKETTRQILKLILPSGIQGILLMLVNVVDLFLISIYLERSAVNGASAGIALISLIIFTIYAFCSAGNIYFGQFLRYNDIEKVKEITSFNILSSYVISGFFIVLFFGIGLDRLNKWVLTDSSASATKQGAKYLLYAFLSFLFMPFILACYSNLVASGHTFIVMLTSSISSICNYGVTFLLLHYNIGHWGIIGVSVATCIARFMEWTIILLYLVWKKPFWLPKLKFWKIRFSILLKVIKTSFYLLPSEIAYPIFLILQQTIAVRYADVNVLAGINVGTMVLDVGFSFLYCLYSAVPVFVASYIGIGEAEKAKINSQKILSVSMLFVIVFFLVILTSAFWLPLFNTALNQEGKTTLEYFLIGNAFGFLLYGIAVQFFIIVKSGGIFIRAVVAEQLPFFALYLPLAIILLKFTNLPPSLVFALVPATLLVQNTCGFLLYYKTKWPYNNLVQHIH